MWNRPTRIYALALVLGCCAMGCSSSDKSSSGVTYSGVISEYTLTGFHPLEGVKVWAVGRPELGSAVTDANGKYVWKGLPPGDELVLRAHEDGWTDGMTTTVVSDTGRSDQNGAVLSKAAQQFLLTTAGFKTLDPSKALLDVDVIAPTPDGGTSAVAGVTVKISPASGTGPVYSSNDKPDPSLTETQPHGGNVFFGNVDPGPIEVTVTAPAGMTCKPTRYSWPPQAGGTISGKVGAGAAVVYEVDCE